MCKTRQVFLQEHLSLLVRTYNLISIVRDMAQKKRVKKGGKKVGRGAQSARRKNKRKGLSLSASAESTKASMDAVLEYYKPLKKPVTLRLDADVLAWFKGGGRCYQTRINGALRKVMEREMKEEGV